MLSISVIELQRKIAGKEGIVLIDVREVYEHRAFNIGGLHIPLHTLLQNINLIPGDKPVVIYCQKGIRSQLAIQRLKQKSGFENLLNLTGGMYAWVKQFGHPSGLQTKTAVGD